MNLSKKLCANIPFTEAISHNCSLSTSEPVAAPTEDKFKCSKFSTKSQVFFTKYQPSFRVTSFPFPMFKPIYERIQSWQNKQRE